MPKQRILSVLLILLIQSCAPPASTAIPLNTESAVWWNNAVFYEIFVRSFYDSDGNGIGDFNGITAKLNYLNDGDPNTTTDLGITGIWLMPIFPSPSYHGYDVTDYYSVNPQYGTMEDFKRLLAEADKRGVRVIIDMVLNHTSDQHPWFKSAKKEVNSPYRNWYSWSKTNPNYKGPWNQRVWHPTLDGYYYGIFEGFMPDLNYQNPEVTAEITKVFSFWLKDVGVDGFRLDAAKHLIEEKSLQQNTQSTHGWYQDFYPVYKEMNPSAMTIGEVFGDNLTISSGYVKNKEFDLIFNFQLASAFISSTNQGKAHGTTSLLKLSDTFIPEAQYAPFLTNHDQNRTMSLLGNDLNKAKLAAFLMLTSPGTPFIYYGEEIGMQGKKPDENIRLPMQWSAETSAGFSTGTPWRIPNADYKEINVASQENDSDSLFNFYRELIQLRNLHSSMRTGRTILLDTGNSGVYAILRADGNEILLVLANLQGETISDYRLTLKEAVLANNIYQAETLFGDAKVQGIAVIAGTFENYRPVNELPPYTSLIVEYRP